MISRIREFESKLFSAEDRLREESQLASIPQEAASREFRRVVLRSVPRSLAPEDIEGMIEKYNFPVQA
jgi:hypothetical protein